MDKKTNYIDDPQLNPQESKINLYKHPHIQTQTLSTRENPQEKTKPTDNQTKKIPPLNSIQKNIVLPPKNQ